MKHIKLPTQKELKRLFNYDPLSGILSRRITINGKAKKGDITTYQDKDGYYQVCIHYQPYRVHRIIYKWFHGDFNETLQIDHIDRKTDNNRIENLRLLTCQQNCHNRGITKHNTSGCTGVDKHGDLWRARICVAGKRKELGQYSDIKDAIKARKAAELNF